MDPLAGFDPPIFWEDLRAGYAVITVENPQGDHVTFRVSAPRSEGSLAFDRESPQRFVSAFTGHDNTKPTSYAYIGMLDEQVGVRVTQGSRLSPDNVKVKTAKWAIMLIRANRPPPQGYRIRASGICLRCGRLLTNPESLTDKYGPECIKRV